MARLCSSSGHRLSLERKDGRAHRLWAERLIPIAIVPCATLIRPPLRSRLAAPVPIRPPVRWLRGLPPIIGPTLGTGPIALPTTITTTTYPLNYHRGYIQSLNFTLQHELAKDFNVQAAFVQTHAIRHTDDVNINAAGPGGGNAGRAYYAITGQTTDITESTPFNTSNYNALQTQLTKRVGAGLVGASYTYSAALDYGDNDDSGLTWAWIPMYQRNYALAGFDRTHNFQAYGNYERAPSAMANNGRCLLAVSRGEDCRRGWQLNRILSRESGMPLTVLTSGSSVNAPGNSQTPNQVLPNVAIPGGHGIGANGASYFNPAAYAPVTTVSLGNSGRDTIRGPGVFNVNASLFRNFTVTEHFKLQFRVETFNLTNTAQFGNPGLTVTAATFNPDGSIKALNGYSQIATASNERQLRFCDEVLFLIDGKKNRETWR